MDGLTIQELKALCKSRGLAVTGIKEDLVRRLQDDSDTKKQKKEEADQKKKEAAKVKKKAAVKKQKSQPAAAAKAEETKGDEPAPAKDDCKKVIKSAKQPKEEAKTEEERNATAVPSQPKKPQVAKPKKPKQEKKATAGAAPTPAAKKPKGTKTKPKEPKQEGQGSHGPPCEQGMRTSPMAINGDTDNLPANPKPDPHIALEIATQRGHTTASKLIAKRLAEEASTNAAPPPAKKTKTTKPKEPKQKREAATNAAPPPAKKPKTTKPKQPKEEKETTAAEDPKQKKEAAANAAPPPAKQTKTTKPKQPKEEKETTTVPSQSKEEKKLVPLRLPVTCVMTQVEGELTLVDPDTGKPDDGLFHPDKKPLRKKCPVFGCNKHYQSLLDHQFKAHWSKDHGTDETREEAMRKIRVTQPVRMTLGGEILPATTTNDRPKKKCPIPACTNVYRDLECAQFKNHFKLKHADLTAVDWSNLRQSYTPWYIGQLQSLLN